MTQNKPFEPRRTPKKPKAKFDIGDIVVTEYGSVGVVTGLTRAIEDNGSTLSYFLQSLSGWVAPHKAGWWEEGELKLLKKCRLDYV